MSGRSAPDGMMMMMMMMIVNIDDLQILDELREEPRVLVMVRVVE